MKYLIKFSGFGYMSPKGDETEDEIIDRFFNGEESYREDTVDSIERIDDDGAIVRAW